MIKAAHLLYSYLPVTQNWIYTQLRFNTSCIHSIISLTTENLQQFPWGPVYAAFPKKSIINRLLLRLAFYWIKQPKKFLEFSIRKINPDIIHGHFSHESCRVLPIVQKAGIPLVTTFYGLDVDKLPRRWVWRRRYRKLFSYGNGFIVEGPFMSKKLSQIGCPTDKIHIVPIGLDSKLFVEPRPLPNSTSSNKSIRILFTGLQREKKGPVDAAIAFCKAAGSLPSLILHCIGDGKYAPVIKKIFKSQGVLDRVIFHGFVSFEKYLSVLSQIDIVLAPSRYASDGDSEGGAPVVCIEAQMAGKPVVATHHCDIPFVVKDGEAGLLCDEGDVDALSCNILRLANDAEMRRRMGEAGRKHAVERHDGGRVGEKLAAVYRLILEKAKGSGNG